MTDLTSYEHKPGAGKTLVSDPNTGQPVEVDIDTDTGMAKMPEKKPTYVPSAEETAAAQKKQPQPTSGGPGAPPPANPDPNNPTWTIQQGQTISTTEKQ
jgi:hypothetical protein